MAKFPSGYAREMLMRTVATRQSGEDQAPAATDKEKKDKPSEKEKKDKPSDKGKSLQQQGEEFQAATGAGEKNNTGGKRRSAM
eukprot:3084344-Pyramimonas_sp.AAC.1